MAYNILHVDDEKEIIKLLKMYLKSEEINHFEAYNGREALTILAEKEIDLLIVDIMMPEIDGFQLIRQVRKTKNLPILVISARITASDRIFGLEIGADDYLTKPFDPNEAIARVKALLRRYHQLGLSATAKNESLQVGQLRLDVPACTAYVEGCPISLTAVEFRVLKLLMEQPGRVFTKEQIYEYGWQDPLAGDNNVRVMMSKLRDKIGNQRIKTIRGLGYRLEVAHGET
ncbi:response regulator transcription factor [Enterococcus devriesei]|uniref:response regulator transcription factor n=1 Tax=Enterococcus devriesei TaxID=319970 RepID=UPI001C116AF4|nr:response regulator transcription factor [Enterococcus devriesei]MBU5366460.1 response regulator transcription factor [Enterococcus devriesei]MDT2823058.1 response regulator transcription factor [Enterococcus devriesei]